MRELSGVVGDFGALGSVEVVGHALVEREEGGGSTDFGTHVANGGHTGCGERFNTRATVLDDGTGSALDGQDTSDLEDNICDMPSGFDYTSRTG